MYLSTRRMATRISLRNWFLNDGFRLSSSGRSLSASFSPTMPAVISTRNTVPNPPWPRTSSTRYFSAMTFPTWEKSFFLSRFGAERFLEGIAAPALSDSSSLLGAALPARDPSVGLPQSPQKRCPGTRAPPQWEQVVVTSRFLSETDPERH